MKSTIIKPQPGFQDCFTRASADVVFGGGILAAGKSYALVLAMAEPLMTDPDFRALISRRQIESLKAGGGFVEKFKDIFGPVVNVRESEKPRASFPNGAFCDLTYIDDSNMNKLKERAKGWEYDMICMDELTEMSWEAFSYIMTRNRGKSKTFTGKFFATMNPKRSHWVREFISWYIDIDGTIRADRDGRIRYFYISGTSVKDVYWGDTKEEVYQQCKIKIDNQLKAIGGDFSYESMIKSFVFYKGALSENKSLISGNAGYVGSVAASGGKTAQALLEGNWNVDPEEDEDIPIPSDKARGCFTADPASTGDRWVTVDLADVGTDNLNALAWDGFHVVDILTISHSTPRENAIAIKNFAQKNQTPEGRVIFDAVGGRYLNDYIPEAMPYVSSSKPLGTYHLTATTMKDLCFIRLVKMINRGQLTFAENVATMVYRHANLKYTVYIQTEFLEECSVVRFRDVGSGKKKLMSKKEMNAMLGKGRSMDLIDPCAMRMMPCVEQEYGSELQHSIDIMLATRGQEDDGDGSLFHTSQGSLYDDNTWA